MTATRFTARQVLWVVPPLVLGVLAFVLMVAGKEPPALSERGEVARAVRVVSVPEVEFLPVAEGFGTVQPAQVWTAVAQVAGRIDYMHPKLRNGEVIAAGTPLFRIDPVDYELSLAQAQAELAELDVRAQNTRASLAIEERNRGLAQRELDRLRQLASKGTTSRSDADQAERNLLNAETAVQNMKNTLALVPTSRRLLEAKVARAERDLANTAVSAPFNLRVASLGMEADQYVSKGQSLFEGDSVDQVEVVAQIALASLRNLFIGRTDSINSVDGMSRDLPGYTGFLPRLQLDMGSHLAEWTARFVRFNDSVDNQTRAIGVVVAVDDPLGQIRPGERPPLSKGMFVRVLLGGRSQPGRLVLPRAAIHDGRVHVVDGDSRLRTRAVQVLFNQGELSVIRSGVQAGEQVVISDLVPAIDGMLLHAMPDAKVQAAMLAAATRDAS